MNDKVMHFLVGFLIFVVFEAVWSMQWAWTAVVAAAVLKEVSDSVHGTGFDVRDILATVAGGVLAFIVTAL